MLHLRIQEIACLAAAAAIVLCFAARAVASEHPIDPAGQPLLVVRVPFPGRVENLFESRQITLLGLSDLDHAGGLPGLPVELDSARFLMKVLAANDAVDFWYCLSQSGLASLHAGLGFTWAQGGESFSREAFTRWLEDNAFDPGRLVLDSRGASGDEQCLAMAGDEATLRALFSGPPGRTAREDSWRASLRTFLNNNSETIGVWFNPRPGLGVLSLLGGIDPRALAARAGLNLPDSVAVELFLGGEELGFEATLGNLLQKPPGEGPVTVVRTAAPGAIDIGFSSPFEADRVAAWLGNPLAAANLDLRPLVPRAGYFSWWRDDDGQGKWNLVLSIPDGDDLSKQGKRFLAAVDILAKSPAMPFSFRRAGSARGGVARLESGGLTAFAVAERRDGYCHILVAGAEDDIPSLDAVTVERAQPASVLRWRVDLDDETRTLVATELTRFAEERNIAVDQDAIDLLLQPIEKGYAAVAGAEATLHSQRGSILLLAPAVFRLAKRVVDDYRADGARRAAVRLRWLREAIGRWRYHGVGGERAEARPHPAALSQLTPDDADERVWLDETLPAFPGAPGTASRILARLADGAVDGFAYRIEEADGDWRLRAGNPDSGDAVRLDGNGVMEKLTDGEWREFPPTPLDMFLW